MSFFTLIKKELMFLQMVVRVLATRVGRSYLQWKKLKIGKVKTKNGYVQIEKIKTKKIGK